MKKITVVVTTYNGAKYIETQLDSLKNQTRAIDEVIILDDCSSDGTDILVKDYIKYNKLTNWFFCENEKNLGWKKNFKIGFDMASGDYIFPCDQDDIWSAEKCERMIKILEEHPEIDLLVSNYTIFISGEDKGSGTYKRAEKRMKNDGSFQMIKFDEKWLYVTRPGCTFCFRKTYFDSIHDDWNDSQAHDAMLWSISRIKRTTGILNESLIQFRRHGDNTTTVKGKSLDGRIKAFNDDLFFYNIARKYLFSESDTKIIRDGVNFYNQRIKMYKNRNPFYLLPLFIKYYKYYFTPRGMLGDIFFIIRGK